MASTIARALNDYGYDYWYDGRMVSAAQRWEDEAGQALANCGSAIVVFDDSYLAKIQDESSGVNPEWAQIDGRIRSVPRDFKLIPVVIDGVRRTSLPPSARQLGIVRWPNEGSSLHAEEVASAIDQLLAAIDSTHKGGTWLVRSEKALYNSVSEFVGAGAKTLRGRLVKYVAQLVRDGDWNTARLGVAGSVLERISELPARVARERIMRLAGLALLLNPSSWPRLTASLSLFPGWFELGPNDPGFARHFRTRLQNTIAIAAERGLCAQVDVMATRGKLMQKELLQVIVQCSERLGQGVPMLDIPYRNIRSRIIVQDGAALDIDQLCEAQTDLERTNVSVEFRVVADEAPYPYHGNRICIEGAAREHQQHLYLGFNEHPDVRKGTRIRPYMYVNSVEPREGVPAELWFVKYAQELFGRWFEHTWEHAKLLAVIGASDGAR